MAFIRTMREMTTFPAVFDDSNSMKTEECIVMETAQKFGSGTKSSGSKKPLNGMIYAFYSYIHNLILILLCLTNISEGF